LGEEEVRKLLTVARRRRFSRNEVVFHHDDLGDSLHLIVKGRFAIRLVAPFGESALIRVRGPREHFGEMALIAEGSRRSATVFALEAGETFAIPATEFERLRKDHPRLDGLLLQQLAAEIRLVDQRLLELLYLPANRRLLRRLSELAVLYNRDISETEVPFTQEQLALDTHRIIKIQRSNAHISDRTKGDSNPVADPWAIEYRLGQTAHRALLSIPYLGTALHYLSLRPALAALLIPKLPRTFSDSRTKAVRNRVRQLAQ
jgi:CRP/FNR family transcriptional regulator, cyclic AMP receptor protein